MVKYLGKNKQFIILFTPALLVFFINKKPLRNLYVHKNTYKNFKEAEIIYYFAVAAIFQLFLHIFLHQ